MNKMGIKSRVVVGIVVHLFCKPTRDEIVISAMVDEQIEGGFCCRSNGGDD